MKRVHLILALLMPTIARQMDSIGRDTNQDSVTKSVAVYR